MLEGIVIKPMGEDFILWRCLHGGPLSRQSINEWPEPNYMGWESRREMNVPVLRKLTETYGTCALLAWDGERVVGSLRFYPKMLFNAGGELCLQGNPTGPHDLLEKMDLLPLEQLEDKTLRVHCLITGSPFQPENPYQRKGLGSAMVRELIRWAREKGWQRIETLAFEDLSILYETTGLAGRRFWEKLGFHMVETHKIERASLPGDPETARRQAVEQGLDPKVAESYIMRLELN